MNTVTDMQRAGLLQDQPDSDALEELGKTLRRNGYGFTTVSPATHARVNSRPGNELAKNAADIFGWSRPFHPSLISDELYTLMRAAGIVTRQRDGEGKFCSRLRVSSLNGELFFHSAYPTMESDSVFFGPDTYRFANAIENFLALHPVGVRRAIDIGCGAGPGAILLAKRFPEAEVLAADINPQALKLTTINAALAGADNVRPCASNLLKDVPGNFDLIVSNPPYLIDPTQRAYRHGGGTLGAGLSFDIVAASLERLNPGGTLLLYTGSAIVDGRDLLREAVEEMLSGVSAQWIYHEMDPDIFGEELSCEAYARTDRIAAVVLRLTKTV